MERTVFKRFSIGRLPVFKDKRGLISTTLAIT